MQYDSAGTLSSISASARIVGSAYETAKMKHSTHNALALLASLVAVSLIVSALRQRRLSAGPPRRAPPIRVGFVGNSFTYYNDLPGVLSRATGLACDARLAPPRVHASHARPVARESTPGRSL